MKIIFFGNSIFTSEAVKLLIRNKKNEITLVSYKNSPDYCVMRALPKLNKKKNFKYIEFERKKDSEAEIIKKDKYDVLIVCSWNSKFPEKVLAMLPAYNIHPSLLPKYRGATPLQCQLKNHEKIGGVTMHLMTKEYDCGPIYKQASFHISRKETPDSIAKKATKKTCVLLKHFIKEFPNIELTVQNEDEATYC